MTSSGPRETVEFDPNVVQRISLKYKTGRIVAGNRGNRVMFATSDNRVFFLDEDVAQLIYDLKLKPSAPFTVCRRQTGDATSWEVLKLGEQGDGTFIVEREKARLDAAIQTQKAGTGDFATAVPASSSCSKPLIASNCTPSKLGNYIHDSLRLLFKNLWPECVFLLH